MPSNLDHSRCVASRPLVRSVDFQSVFQFLFLPFVIHRPPSRAFYLPVNYIRLDFIGRLASDVSIVHACRRFCVWIVACSSGNETSRAVIILFSLARSSAGRTAGTRGKFLIRRSVDSRDVAERVELYSYIARLVGSGTIGKKEGSVDTFRAEVSTKAE